MLYNKRRACTVVQKWRNWTLKHKYVSCPRRRTVRLWDLSPWIDRCAAWYKR